MSIYLDPEKLGAGNVKPKATAIPESNPPITAYARPMGPIRRVFWGIGFFLANFFKGGVSGLILLVLTVVLLQRYGPPDMKPSAMMGEFGGNKRAAEIRAFIEEERALIAALETEKARAQQLVVATQAENERVTQAYRAQFERANMLAATWAETAKNAAAIALQVRMEGLRGRFATARTKDNFAMLCDGLSYLDPSITCGDSLRESAYNDREAATNEVMSTYRKQLQYIAATYTAWAKDLPDPAAIATYKASFDHLYPEPAATLSSVSINKS